MDVVVDTSRCQGIGMCESVAPELFEVTDDAQARVLRAPTDADRSLLDDAVAACPTLALSVRG